MPNYLYTCPGCPITITITRTIDSEEHKPICANCAQVMKRSYDPPPIHLKGTGWGKD